MSSEFNKRTGWEKLRAICQAQGLKATRQRIEILRAVCRAKDHPSADAVYRQVKKQLPAISFDTVYRTLNSLEEHKLISRVHYLDDKSRYDPDLSEHHHFICTKCKKIVDFQWPGFGSLRLPKSVSALGQIRQKYAEIRGICAKCSRSR